MHLSFHRRIAASVLLLSASALVAAACNSEPRLGLADRDSDSDSGNGGADSGSDSGADSDSDSDIGNLDVDAGGGGPIGNGNPEICDGIDNNADGAIDNIDAGGDGICDCLNIGTIGWQGPWGKGNIFKTWLNERSPIPARELPDTELTEEAIAGLDVIVILRADTAARSGDDPPTPAHHAFSPDEVAVLENWVRAGGGLMTTIGYQSSEDLEVVNVNKLLAPFDLSYDGNSDVTNMITTWEEHAITDGVSAAYTANGSEPSGEGTVLAWQGDKPAMIVSTPDDGRIIVWADEWITYNETWADEENQQIELLWLNMIKWMSPPARCQVPIPPGIK